MMAVIAEGRNYDRDDTLADAKTRGSPVLCALSVQDITKIQETPRTQRIASNHQEQTENVVANRLTKTMAVATAAARRVVESQRRAPMHAVSEQRKSDI